MRVIHRLSEHGSVRGAYIARELGVSKPTVSVALKEMEAEGYVIIKFDRTIELTEKGKSTARYVARRNRVIFELLTDLGVDKQTAGKDACEMEHCVSEKTLQAFIELRQYLRAVNKLD